MKAVEELQKALFNMPQVDIKTSHTFCDGVYAREITIPKDVAIVGAKHLTSFFMVISKGKCVITSNNEKNEYKAPCTLISPIGAKRAIMAIEETVLTTFHATKETSVGKIESEIIENEGFKIANSRTELECHT
ncbi:hypothetical protein [Pseudoalteromonas marina]|uniref:hypothetical protein n=1 Tax=Pseudoalteromonas marina TaxID=267375 RepID=UPI003C40F667